MVGSHLGADGEPAVSSCRLSVQEQLPREAKLFKWAAATNRNAVGARMIARKIGRWGVMSKLEAIEPVCTEHNQSGRVLINARSRDLGGFKVRRVLPAALARRVGPFEWIPGDDKFIPLPDD